LTGVVLLSIRLFSDLMALVHLISAKKKSNDNIIIFNNFNTSGFSAFGYIFINEKLSPGDTAEVIRHEQKHLEHFHSLDIIFIEIIRVVQWVNPFIHLYCRSLRTVHEYQADSDCLKAGMPVSSYQGLLLNQIFGSKVYTVTNSFYNPTLIKKRMVMMTKESSCSLANLKLLLVLPVIAGIMVIISSCKEKNTEINVQEISPSTPIMIDGSAKVVKGEPSPADMLAPPPPPPPPVPGAEESRGSTPYDKVDVMPVFPGGDQGLVKFIAENISYPESAKMIGTQGKVFVKFAVEKDGSVDQLSILQSVDPLLDAEALRVVGKLPKFENPGLINGKPVAVWYIIPINFALK
jgi:TonB family protein